MKLLKFALLASAMCYSSLAIAQPDAESVEGVQSFQQNKDSWRRQDEEQVVIPTIIDVIGNDAVNNIINAEQVFCYEVDLKSSSYDGYTLDNFALTGFCGVINPELRKTIVSELFMNKKNILFDVREQCVIKPKVILRFFKGIDSTDILLSSPCYSYTVFYGGRNKTFNTKPAAVIIDTLITSFAKNKTDFASPALFNQLLPIGVAQTPEQKEMLKKNNKPIRKWEGANDKKEPAAKASGWNNLDIGF